MKKRKAFTNLIIAFLAMLSVYAVTAKEELVATTIAGKQNVLEKAFQLVREMSAGTTPVVVLAIILILVLFEKHLFAGNRKMSIPALVTSGIFAAFRVLGISFSIDNSLNYLIQSRFQSLHAILVFSGYWVLLYVLIKVIFSKIDAIRIVERHGQAQIVRLVDKHMFLVAFLTMLICWGTFWMLYFPGSLPHDGQHQLEIYFGARAPGQHHPYISTLVMGAIVRLGDALHSYQLGIALYVIFQSVVCASIYASQCAYIRSKKVPLSCVMVVIAIFSLMPLFASYAQAVIKDTLYIGFFTWFAMEYIKCYLKEGGIFTIVRMIISSILCCLYRNEAIYIIAVSLIVLFLVSKERCRWVASVLVAVCVLYATAGFIITDVMDVPKGSIKEAMSIPLQQTARYVNKHESEITKKEQAIINEVVDYSILTTKYTPEKSDNVKNTWKNPTDEEFSAYLSLWFELFQRDPIVYVEAMLNHVFGYIDPFCDNINAMQHQSYNKGPISSAQKEITINTYYTTDAMRKVGENYTALWNKLPILSTLCFCGVYTWVGILLIANLLRKGNWRDAMIFILPLMTLLVCFASPVNNYSRYMLPIIASMPLLCWFGLKNHITPKESYCEGNS